MVLEESALSAVEAAADAVIGERFFGDHHHDNVVMAMRTIILVVMTKDGHWSSSSGMIEGEESFQDAANSVMEAAGAIAGQD